MPFITIGIISIFKDSDYFVYNMKEVLYLFHDKTIVLYFFLLLYALFLLFNKCCNYIYF